MGGFPTDIRPPNLGLNLQPGVERLRLQVGGQGPDLQEGHTEDQDSGVEDAPLHVVLSPCRNIVIDKSLIWGILATETDGSSGLVLVGVLQGVDKEKVRRAWFALWCTLHW
jgi:hypothetical protein